MLIGSIIPALQAQRYLERTSKAFTRALQRLASGSRINSARDDAAGLAIATGLDAQVRGLRQVSRNINDAFGYLQTADGAIATQTEIVQRMRELALQSASGTLGDSERTYLDSEFQQLLVEFQRISAQTNFNGTNLLDGNFDDLSLQVGTQKEDSFRLKIDSLNLDDIWKRTERMNSFSTKQSFNITPDLSFRAMASADINGDGFKDLVANVYASGTQTILLNNGNGGFTAAPKINGAFIGGPGGGNQSLQIADLNNDGNADILSTHLHDSNLRVQLGNGDGTFKAAIAVASTGSGGILAKDLNADGNLDVIVARSTSTTVLLGNGDGHFSVAQTFTHVGDGNGAAQTFADFNGDGVLDIMRSITNSGATQFLLGVGDGTFQLSATGLNREATGAADFNNDGILDYITRGGGTSSTNIIYGAANMTLGATAISNLSISNLGNFHLSDFDGDGQLDLGSYDGTTYLLNAGGGSVKSSLALNLNGGVFSDFNNDGYEDFVAQTSSTSYSFNVKLTDTQEVADLSLASIDTQDKAQNSLQFLDEMLAGLSTQRASIGAQESRLESAANVTTLTTENLSQARSQILDTDYAEETAEMMKQQILQQAGVSVMAQAQLQMQMVMSLLGGLK